MLQCRDTKRLKTTPPGSDSLAAAAQHLANLSHRVTIGTEQDDAGTLRSIGWTESGNCQVLKRLALLLAQGDARIQGSLGHDHFTPKVSFGSDKPSGTCTSRRDNPTYLRISSHQSNSVGPVITRAWAIPACCN